MFRLSVTLAALPGLIEPESGAIDAVNLTFSVMLFAALLRPVMVKFILWSSSYVSTAKFIDLGKPVPGSIVLSVSSLSSLFSKFV